MIASPNQQAIPSAQALAQAAAQTGGAFWTYAGDETPPNPENYLAKLRQTYLLTYISQVKSGGSHTLVIEAGVPGETIASPGVSFEINLQPPNPVFVSPPLVIKRNAPTVSGNGEQPVIPEMFEPREQAIQILIDFPDGRPRALRRMALYVDGVLVAQNTSAPFEYFLWDLSAYTTSGMHQLRVEVEDALGLAGSSIETQVEVSVQAAEEGNWSIDLGQNFPVLAVLAIVLAGAALTLVFIVGGRLQPNTLGALQTVRRKADPVTQPVRAAPEPPQRRLGGWISRLRWPQRPSSPQPLAFLVSIADQTEIPGPQPIPEEYVGRAVRRSRPGGGAPLTIALSAAETTFGRSAAQAMIVLDDPTLEALHTRIVNQEDGSFRIYDQGTIAGTWVNYTPISSEGARLEHEDIIHIGRLGFRFQARNPLRVRRPVITPLAPEQPPEARQK
jgi:hypothetical protein